MSFYQRYELLDLTKDGPVKTFAAREKSSGRQVSVHLLPGGRASHGELVAGLDQLPERMRTEIREQGEHEGTIYVVTDIWMRSASFAEWVIGSTSAAPSGDRFARAGNWRVPTAEFGKRSAPAPPPGEFTKVFRAVTPPAQPVREDAPTIFAGMPAATPPIPEPIPEPPADPEPDQPMPGTPVVSPSIFPSGVSASGLRRSTEFDETVEFAVPSIPSEKPEPRSAHSRDDTATVAFDALPAPPPDEFSRLFGSVPEPPTAGKTPGDFTKMFGAPKATPEPPAAAPGEFTRMFQTGGVPVEKTPAPPRTPSLADQPSSAAGEFSKFFGTEPTPPSANPHPAYKDPFGEHQPITPGGPSPGEFTRMFGPAKTATPVPFEPSPTPLPEIAPPTAGAYTRMFSPASATPLPAPVQEPLPRPVAPEPRIAASQSGGGEYTRMMQTPAAAGPLATPTPAPPTRPRPRPNYTPLFVGLGILLVLAILLLLFFLLRK